MPANGVNVQPASPQDLAQIQNALNRVGVSGDQVSQVQNVWTATTTGVATAQGLIALSKGDASQLGPILGIAASLTPIGPVGGAIVAAAFPLFQSFLSLFGGGPQACPGWFVGSWCFPGPRPEGPLDRQGKPDSLWASFMSFDDSGGDPQRARPSSHDADGRPFGSYPLTVKSEVGAAFPWYFVILCDEQAFASQSDADLASYFQTDPANVPAIRQFYQAYYALWRLNAEAAINGFNIADGHALLGALTDSWNKSHDGSRQVALQRKEGASDQPCWGGTYLELLIGGAVDGQGDDVTFNAGPVNVDPNALANNLHLLLNLGPGVFGWNAPSPPSATKTVAVTAAGGVGLAALGTLAYSWATGQAFGTVVKHAWRWLTGGKK